MAKIKMDKDDLLSEHKHLLSVLQNPTKKKLLAEYIKQKREMKDYES
jgi:hypothetical protein